MPITVDYITKTVPGVQKSPTMTIGFKLIWEQHIKYVVLLPKEMETRPTTST